MNRTPLTSDTNRRVINNKLPNQYLPEMIKTNGRNHVEQIMESHFISPDAIDILLRDPFLPDDFEEFISERQKTLKDSIENLLIKERIDLPVILRELDSDIEKVEIGLRELVIETTKNETSTIPHHIQDKVSDRISAAVKKNAALDADFLETIEGRLEYFDLREIQSTLEAKANWEFLEPKFKSKEKLSQRFDQLAELRNSIRHSRSVSPIVQKEGEASILWFSEILGRK